MPGSANNNIKLVVFDWDGTLADSTALIVSAMQSAIRELQYQERSDMQIRDVIGLGLVEALQSLFPGMTRECHELASACYRRHYAKRAQETSLFPGVPETLRTLQQQQYRMAIATGKSRKGLNSSLRLTGLQDFFHATRCADETCSKPHPRMLLELLDDLDIRPAEAVMVGDSEFDMQMATHAGMHAVAACYGVHDRSRLLQYQPRACLESIGELPGHLSTCT